ncbi:MAG TPA: hypothetical protein VGG61_14325 [Gemmataceae bacterium]
MSWLPTHRQLSFSSTMVSLSASAILVGSVLVQSCLLNRAFAAPAPPMDLEKSLKKASVDGKYAMLLHQFKDEKDGDEYGDFHEYGFRNVTEHHEQKDLTKGYWVYVQPYWYIWEKRTDSKRQARSWGPEQATGEPNVAAAGDNGNAWASKTEDAEDEWLLLEYDQPTIPTHVLVHETFNPGAVNRVTVFKLDGAEVEAWKDDDPTKVGSGQGISEIPLKVDFKITRVKLYIDSKNVKGWNEIDAVGLRDKGDKVHWAAHAAASSTYAPPFPAEDMTATYEEKIERLQAEIKRLKKTIEELKKTAGKDK